MLLLISGCSKAADCADALRSATTKDVAVADSLKKAEAMVQKREYEAIIVDQWLAEGDPEAWSRVIEEAGLAHPIVVNTATSSKQRLVGEVKVALEHQQRTRALAMKSAEAALRSELREAITAVLFASESALRSPGLGEVAQRKIQSVYGAANELRTRFEGIR